MHLRRAFTAHSSLSRTRWVRVAAVTAATTLLLAACGGGGGDDTKWETAFQVVGHKNFQKDDVNDGQSTPQAYTLATPFGNVATDGAKLYIADTANNRVLGWTSIPSANGQNADFVLGQDGSFTTKTSGLSASKLSQPYMAAISSSGQLVVTDTGNNRVLIWNEAPTTSSVAPSIVVGQGGSFTSNTSGLSAQALNAPTAAIIDSSGRLIVCDQGNNRVLIWNDYTKAATTDAGVVLGQVDFTSNAGNVVSDSALYKPTSIWSDGTQLLVADTGNYRVMYWNTFPQASGIAASYVVGQAKFTQTVSSTSATTFVSPTAVASDGAQFWVADRGSNRVLKYDSMPASNGMSASLVYGQGRTSFTSSAANDDDQNGSTDNSDDDIDNGAATEHTLNAPTGVYVEGGVLYITDRGNNRVEMYAP
jgi:sugar lactone lactonase YvrE